VRIVGWTATEGVGGTLLAVIESHFLAVAMTVKLAD
jgi:hypothetical protein